ncbi:hypothetical protein EBZ39_09225, partial [bacterium]|nr:hypothetical protein [bacterium]
NGALSVDATLVVVANRILVKNQANQAYNGVYTVTQVGDGSNPFILTRATDYNTAGSGVNQIDAGDFFLITAGATLANTSWVQQTPLPITVGTTALVFSQFGAPITYSAGTGLSESPAYTFNIANTGVTSGNYGGASTVPALSINAQGQITSATNTSIAIAASQVTSGQLAIAQGGTNGSATPTAGAVPYGTGTAYAFSAAGTSSQVLLSGGTGSPTWTNQSSLSVGSATTATNLAGGAANRIAYQTGAAATSFITAPSVSSTYLQWNGSAFVWASAGTGSVTSVDVSGGTTGLTTSGGPITTSGTITLTGTLVASNGGTGQSTYTTGDILYASSSSALSKLGIGTNGQVLTSSGTAPQYVNQSSLSVGSATNATNTAITDDTTNATMYPTWVTANTGNLPQKVTSTKLTFNPSTGVLTVTGGISGGTF